MPIPTPKQSAEKQKSKPARQPTLTHDQIEEQKTKLIDICIKALEVKKSKVPIKVSTNGFSKNACDYVKRELVEAGWKVENVRDDGEFVFKISESAQGGGPDDSIGSEFE